MQMKQKPLIFTEETILHVGDYFRVYKSKYFTRIKEIAYDQRNFEFGYGEYTTTLLKIDIYDKEENLLATNSIVPIDNLISGALAKYIPDLTYDPSYLGNADPYNYPTQYSIWKDMLKKCFDCTNSIFPYIGGVGTIVCDRWRCFEYFVADFKHIAGYSEAGDSIFYQHYIVDLYDIQKHLHPSQRVYAPGYVKLKPFKQSDICRYANLPPKLNNYPKDIETTMKYRTGKINIQEALFSKQTGMNTVLDLDNASYYYDNTIGYQPLAARMFYPYMNYYNPYIINKPVKEMCRIIRKD